MEMIFKPSAAGMLGEVTDKGVVVSELSDALDVIGDCMGNGCTKVIMGAENFAPELFDLSTRVLGEVLQKFTQYHVRLAIAGDFSNVESKSLRDFIRESNKAGQVVFMASREEAAEYFGRG